MGLDLEDIKGHTQVDEDEKEAMLIPTIAPRGELVEIKPQNIEMGIL